MMHYESRTLCKKNVDDYYDIVRFLFVLYDRGHRHSTNALFHLSYQVTHRYLADNGGARLIKGAMSAAGATEFSQLS